MAAAGLRDGPGRLDDLGERLGVAEVVVGDLAEGVALANRVGLGGSLVGGGVGAADGEGQDPAGTKEVVSLAVEEAGVEGGDLGVAASVAEFGGCDRPQRLAALDGVLPGLNRRRRVLDGVRRRV